MERAKTSLGATNQDTFCGLPANSQGWALTARMLPVRTQLWPGGMHSLGKPTFKINGINVDEKQLICMLACIFELPQITQTVGGA